jgi:hypothetical protein
MNPSLIGSWAVSFATGSDPEVGPSNLQDGTIQLWKNNWMVLKDQRDVVIEGCYLNQEEKIWIGSTIIFPNHFARILRSVIAPNEVRVIPADDFSPDTSEPVSVVDGNWEVSYSMIKDLDRGHLKAYDGTMRLCSSQNWLVLLNAKGHPISVKSEKPKLFAKGTKIQFSHHVVRVGDCMLAPSVPAIGLASAAVVHNENLLNSSSSSQLVTSGSIEIPLLEDCSNSSGAVYDSIALGLDFSKGFSFAKEIKRLFSSSVHPKEDSFKFKMVVSFGRAAFRLTEDIVAVALEAAIGGYCGSLQVTMLSERVFSFVVASKQVGFYILKTRFFACDKFKCYFHLWSNGGPDWQREWRLWQENSEKEWTLVSPSKRRTQMGLRALAKPRPKSAIKHTVSLAKSLQFAPTIQYVAHKGYGPKVQASKENAMVHWTKTSPSIKFATVRPFESLEKKAARGSGAKF